MARESTTIEGLEPVRKRPGMFVGGTNTFFGIFNMIFEVAGNVVDQYYARNATELHVELGADSWVTVRDDGPGVPVDIIERVFTTLSRRPTFDGHFPHVHIGRLQGVGLGVVSALSERAEIETTRDGIRWAQAFERGVGITKLRKLGRSTVEGTSVRFRPDPTIFKSIELDVPVVEKRLQELAWLLPHLRVFLNGRRLYGRGGIVGWAHALTGARKVKASFGVDGIVDGIRVEVGLAWAGQQRARVRSFANTLETPEGGTHVQGLWEGLAAYAKSAATEVRTPAAARRALGPGIAATVHVEMLHPSYGGPTKNHLESPEAASAVREVVHRGLTDGLPFVPQTRSFILDRLEAAPRPRRKR